MEIVDRLRYIINDLSEEEEELLYNKFPLTEYVYIKIALGKLQQSFLDVKDSGNDIDSKVNGIYKENDNIDRSVEVIAICKERINIEALNYMKIGVLGYESTSGFKAESSQISWEYETGDFRTENTWLPCKYVTCDLRKVTRRDFDIIYARSNGLPLKILETARCIVREQTIEDFEGIKELYKKDDEYIKFVEELFDDDEEIEYQKNYIDVVYGFFNYGIWVVVDKKTDEIIGRAGIENKEGCETLDEVELSYQIKKNYRNKGIAHEVCEEIVKYAFDEIGVKKINARISPYNIPSIRLVKSLGFENEDKTNAQNLEFEREKSFQDIVKNVSKNDLLCVENWAKMR